MNWQDSLGLKLLWNMTTHMDDSNRFLVAIQAGLITKEDIIIDAKSGVSGAGRSAKQNLLYTEIAEGINSYGVTKHRHMPEIEQVRFTLPAYPYSPVRPL